MAFTRRRAAYDSNTSSFEYEGCKPLVLNVKITKYSDGAKTQLCCKLGVQVAHVLLVSSAASLKHVACQK